MIPILKSWDALFSDLASEAGMFVDIPIPATTDFLMNVLLLSIILRN
jgi:hypothetical protein